MVLSWTRKVLLDRHCQKETVSIPEVWEWKGWGGGTSKSYLSVIACLCFLQMLLGLSKSVIKPWLFCQIATSSWLRLKKQQTHITSASSCSCCPSQKDHRKQSGSLWESITWKDWQPPRGSACPTQRRQSGLYLTEPQGLLKTEAPGKWCAGYLSLIPSGAFSTLVVRKHSQKDNSMRSTPRDGSGFPYLNYSPTAMWACLPLFPGLNDLSCEIGFLRKPTLPHSPACGKWSSGCPQTTNTTFIHKIVVDTYSVQGAVVDVLSDSEKNLTLSLPWRSLKSSRRESRVHN